MFVRDVPIIILPIIPFRDFFAPPPSVRVNFVKSKFRLNSSNWSQAYRKSISPFMSKSFT